MKRLFPLLVVVVACLVLAPVALAQSRVQCDPPGGWGGGAATFRAVGSVSSVDTSGTPNTITVAVDCGRPDLCQSTITVNITSDTQLFAASCGQKSAATMADVAVGDQIALCGTVDSSSGSAVYTASVVCVRVPHFACSGSVSAVDTTDTPNTITVAVDCGRPDLCQTTITVNITDDTQLFSVACGQKSAATMADVAVGDRIAVRGTIDSSSGSPVYTASVVCVHVPHFACVGSVSGTDTTDTPNTITVAVDRGRPDLCQSTIPVIVTADTQLFSVAGGQRSAVTLGQINNLDRVAVCGTIDASSGSPLYTATAVFDFGAAASLPTPVCQPGSLQVGAKHAGRGDALKLGFKVSDPMPGAGTANVTLALTTMKGRKLASLSVSGVTLNKATKVSFKLRKALIRGTYRIVARATDWAGNQQLKAATAILKVK